MDMPPAFREDDLPTLLATMQDARLADLATATAEDLVAPPPVVAYGVDLFA